MTKQLLLLTLLAVVASGRAACAFSPYEAYLLSDGATHVGLIAEVKPGQSAALADCIEQCATDPARRKLADVGIANMKAFTREIEGRDYVVIYFAFDGRRDYLTAAAAFEEATAAIPWAGATAPHPRATTYARHWLQMEWINFIRGAESDDPPSDSLMMGTTVIPEKEMEYRTLHQTTWPGVVDQAKRGKIRNLNIFLVELDDQLVEFLYLEYVGGDQAADDAANAADPINQRWWKLTDACQRPFSDVAEGIWAPLEAVQTPGAGSRDRR